LQEEHVRIAAILTSRTGECGRVLPGDAFDTDMRFMQGAYVDVDGRLQNGSFGFI
jgi:hypothetical protein